MAFKKTFSSNNIEDLSDGIKFSKGCKFIRDGKKWTITDSFVSDNTSMTRILSNDGTEEIVMTSTLIRDFSAGDIKFVQEVDSAGIELAKIEAENARIKKTEEEKGLESDGAVQINLEEEENKHKFHKKF